MSMPKFPTDTGNLTRDNVINQILSSIAMEELGISHVLNAEGEKMQYVLGTLEGVAPLTPAPTVDQVLQTNDSIQQTLGAVATQQLFLKTKMSDVLEAAESAISMPHIGISKLGDWYVAGVDTGVTALGDISVGEDGNWYIDGVDTNVPAVGLQGPVGAEGTAPVITIGANGDWYINGADTGQSAVSTMNTVLSVSATNTWVLDGVDTGVPVMGMLSIGSNGNWYIDGTDTGVQAQGIVGPAGAQGQQGALGATAFVNIR